MEEHDVVLAVLGVHRHGEFLTVEKKLRMKSFARKRGRREVAENWERESYAFQR